MRKASPIFLPLLLALAAVLVCVPAAAQELRVDDARMRLPLPGQTVAVVYFNLHNLSSREQVLVGVEVDGAGRAEMHQHQHVDGMMQMREVLQVSVAAGERVEFRPHGYHVMVFDIGVATQPDPGGSRSIKLIFRDGTTVVAMARLFRY